MNFYVKLKKVTSWTTLEVLRIYFSITKVLNNSLFPVVVKLKSSRQESLHYDLFIREHSDKTIEVLNIPPFATESNVSEAFSCVGTIKQIRFETKVFYVTYVKRSSVDKALNLKTLPALVNLNTGLRKWVTDQTATILNTSELQQQVNLYMRKYDTETAGKKKNGKEVDQEGWTVVTKQGLLRKEAVMNKVEDKASKGMKHKQLTDFYVFQKRESKLNQIVEMRKRYNEDKKKMNAMKQARRFRPYS